jgi:hypothetical protein
MKKLLCIFLMMSSSVFSQSAFTLKYFGLTIHPFGDRTADIQPYKLDNNARFGLNFGGYAGYEQFIYKDLISVKLIQGLFTDCSAGWMSVTHLGLRALMYENEKNRGYIALGPTFMMRESWSRFGSGYNASGFFKEKQYKNLGAVQQKFVLYGLELEYDRILNDRNSFSLSFTPGLPLAMVFSFGWKHWLSRGEFDYTRLARPRK